MGMNWNLTDWHKSMLTNHTIENLNGLLINGFTGVSNTSGHKVMIWDRDFALRGENDPAICPVNNWVSMPFVKSRGRWESVSAKFNSYDIWDKYCPSKISIEIATAKSEAFRESQQIRHTCRRIPWLATFLN
jgi:hypothetical protein